MLRPVRHLGDRIDPLWAVAALAWIAAVLVVNSTPDSMIPRPSRFSLPPHADKVVHFFMYGTMAMLVWNALVPARPARGFRAPAGLAVAIPCTIGLLDELHQRYVPGRSCDPLDLLVDCIGAGVVVYAGTRKPPAVSPRAFS